MVRADRREKPRAVGTARVRALLSKSAIVAHMTDAPAEAGGWGATLVTLRPK